MDVLHPYSWLLSWYTAVVAYNIVLNTGSMQNWVFLAVFHEWPIMTVIAILLELVFVGKLAMKVAFRLVNPREASQTSIYACHLGCIRMADVPVHELLCHPAVQGQP